MGASQSLSIVPATQVPLSDLVALVVAQASRLVALDPRLDGILHTPSAVEATLVCQLRQADRVPIALQDHYGRVRGYGLPNVWELAEHSLLHAFLTPRNGIARSLTLPPASDPDAAEVVATMLTALTIDWRNTQSRTTGDLIRWPMCDAAWLRPILEVHEFVLDSICAFRPQQAPLPMPSSEAASIELREASPADEEALVRLFEEELRVHEQCVPCARVSPAAICGFRQKLARLWQGGRLDDGAPLVLVATREQQVVGMAECVLLDVDHNEEPGWTPPGRYGCLDNVCVAPTARGQGIGAYLTRAALAIFASQPSLDGSLLWYSPDNRFAADFWTRRGFLPLWATYQRIHSTSI
jgi:ribosomal protein S18 acetylase RimI-like enzyme